MKELYMAIGYSEDDTYEYPREVSAWCTNPTRVTNTRDCMCFCISAVTEGCCFMIVLCMLSHVTVV